MNTRIHHTFLLAAVTLGIALPVAAEKDHFCRAPTKVEDFATPINYPDQFAWKLFLQVNKKADKAYTTVDGKKTELNNAHWETWIDDSQNFPAKPNPSEPPKWPKQFNGHHLMLASFKHDTSAYETGEPDCQLDQGTCEVVYRNKPTFDYIVANGLWYQEGIASFFASGKEVSFPLDSIEVKGNWKKITEAEKSSYHWNYTSDGQLIGLVAMHISSKAIPNWLWATFEHVDNPGRCDLLGCYDCYGTSQHETAPDVKKIGGTYAAEPMSEALKKQFRDHDYKGEWLKQWEHYRLKGTMVDFTDSYGHPNLLGNSVTESGFVATSSCMSCHARAAVTAEGKKAFPFFGELPTPVTTAPIPAQYGYQTITANGTPVPADFYQRQSNLYKDNPYGTLKYLQTDFVWSIPMRAQPMSATNTTK